MRKDVLQNIRKYLNVLFLVIFCCGSLTVKAAEEEPAFLFEMSIEGDEVRELLV